MKQSEQLDQLAAALSKAQAAFPPIKKSHRANAGQYSYTYADLGDIRDAVSPVLSANGLAVTQLVDSLDGELALTTVLIHESGQHISATAPVVVAGQGAQAAGSGLTYARRYGLTAILGIVAEDDDDGAGATQHTSTRPAPVPGQRTFDAEKSEPGGQITTADPAISRILEAAGKIDDEFLSSLASQFAQRGRLTEKQIAAGTKKANMVLGNSGGVATLTPEGDPWDEERF